MFSHSPSAGLSIQSGRFRLHSGQNAESIWRILGSAFQALNICLVPFPPRMHPRIFPHHFPAAVLPGIDRKVSSGLGLMVAQEHLPATILKLQTPERVLQSFGNLGLCSFETCDSQSSPPLDPELLAYARNSDPSVLRTLDQH